MTSLISATTPASHSLSFDEVTGLFDRAALIQHLDEKIADDATVALGGIALLRVDFQSRHAAEKAPAKSSIDEVEICAIARKLSKTLRESDFISRLDGARFLVVIPQVSDTETAERVADKIIRAFASVAPEKNADHAFDTSIGISMYPQHGRDRDVLLEQAERALLRAKQSGLGKFEFA
jgi:diguanylate cyclase (GGDEF)-like protein